jgi:hypothetical protein
VDFGTQKKDVYKRPPQQISFSKRHLRIFLMENLVGWKQPFSDHHKEEDASGRNTLHTYLVKGYCLIVVKESRAK